ncbi:MAG: polysaccharide lyase family 1 protein [Geminicoccaceae bacterium]
MNLMRRGHTLKNIGLGLLCLVILATCARIPDPEIEPPRTVKAFPGALGFGADASGGRGGKVVRVTNLRDAGEGSLRWALEDLTGPRIVIFDVAGLITLRDQIRVNGDVTVAGQTAPGALTIRGARLQIVGSNVIIRGLRLRPGDDPNGQDPESRDALSIGAADRVVEDVIIDRNSLSWATDENAATWFPVRNVSLSNNIIAEGLNRSIHPEGEHSMGALIGDDAERISVIANIFAHNKYRNPQAKNARAVEIFNNLIYNYGPGGVELLADGETPSTARVAGNLFIPGAASLDREPIRLHGEDRAGRYVVEQNLALTLDSETVTSADRIGGDGRSRVISEYAFSGSGYRALATDQVESHVLAYAGARVPDVDPIDRRILASVRDRTGDLIDTPAEVGGYLLPEPCPRRPDSDGDGMPDQFELDQGFDPSIDDAGLDDDADGYTNIEEYLNALISASPGLGAMAVDPVGDVSFEAVCSAAGLT